MNTVFAFLLGWMSHYVSHVNPWRRTAGFLIIACWVTWLAFFNLAVAHYRDALGGPDPDNAGIDAVKLFLSNTVAIHDFQSMLLLVLGGVFSAIAFYDGRRMDDPYPGYGPVTRKWEEAGKKFQEARRKEEAALTRLKDDSLARIRQETDYVPSLEGRLRQQIRYLAELAASWEREMENLERAANTLAEIYREANRHARTTPPPAHFGLALKIQRPDNPITRMYVHSDGATAAQITSDLSQTDGAAAQNSAPTASILHEYVAAIESLPTLEEL